MGLSIAIRFSSAPIIYIKPDDTEHQSNFGSNPRNYRSILFVTQKWVFYNQSAVSNAK